LIFGPHFVVKKVVLEVLDFSAIALSSFSLEAVVT